VAFADGTGWVGGGEGLSRGAVLKGALAASAVAGLGVAGPLVRGSLAAGGASEIDTLNFLLKFEYLEFELYDGAMSRLKAGDETMRLVETIAAQERQHVEALVEHIGKLHGEPIPRPGYASFSYRPNSVDTFLLIARELETAVIGAYNGAIPSLISKEALRLATSIVQVEGRHAAAVALQRGEPPAPRAFDQGQTEYQSLNSVVKYTGPAIFREAG